MPFTAQYSVSVEGLSVPWLASAISECAAGGHSPCVVKSCTKFAVVVHLDSPVLAESVMHFLSAISDSIDIFFLISADFRDHPSIQNLLLRSGLKLVFVERAISDNGALISLNREHPIVNYQFIYRFHSGRFNLSGCESDAEKDVLLLNEFISHFLSGLQSLSFDSGVVLASDGISFSPISNHKVSDYARLLTLGFSADIDFSEELIGHAYWFRGRLFSRLNLDVVVPEDFSCVTPLADVFSNAFGRAFLSAMNRSGYRIKFSIPNSNSSDCHCVKHYVWTDRALDFFIRPKFGVFILYHGGPDSPALHATIRSVSDQSRAPDEIVLIRSLSELPTFFDHDWSMVIAEGDFLECRALEIIESVILRDSFSTSSVLIYTDHEDSYSSLSTRNLSFKPKFSEDLLHSSFYIGRSLLFKSQWVNSLSTECFSYDNLLQACYFLALKASSEEPSAVHHVPLALFKLSSEFEPTCVTTTADWTALASILQKSFDDSGQRCRVMEGPAPGTFHVGYPINRFPKVTIVIPTKDQLSFLSLCVESLLSRTDYPEFEVLVIDNDSQTPEAQVFLSGLEQVNPDRIRVLRVPGAFNFSRMNNLAVAQARGEFILLLNNDTAVLQADWLSHMMRHALRDGVGIVGARLVYPEGTVQHAGVIMGLRGPADHPCLGLKPDEPGYMFRAQLTQNFSAVTAACMLVSKAVYEEVGGLDEVDFAVSYNDVDFCLKVGQTGRRIVWSPLATLLHEGSASQKASIENLSQANKAARFTKEQAAMYRKWPDIIANDPAYNPNLSLVERGYEVETNPLLCFDPLRDFYEHKVVAFAADAMGCGNYRILQPMQAMLKDDLCLGGASPEIFGPNLALRSRADVLVFQRPNDDRGIQTLEALIPLKGVKKIYEVDDNLTRVPVKSAHFAHMPKDTRGRMLKSMGLCDRLIVSTEPLAHDFKHANGDVRVVPNRLPPAMWGVTPPKRDPQARQGRKPVVGWAGGVGHRGDLEMVAQVIKDLADQVDWEFFGMCPDALKPYVKRVHTGVPTLEYPARLMALSQNWDLAIAPLEVNAFNESKSNLRLLEYGWCGLPVVCSDVTPYQGQMPVTRVKNRHKDWKSALLEKLADLPKAQQHGLALQAEIQANWMLQGQHVVDWYKAWTD